MMKKLIILPIAILMVTAFSCKDAKKGFEDGKKDAEKPMKEVANKFSLVNDSTKVSFTAYKTTEKKPVGGQFLEIDITNSEKGTSALDALNGTTFKIPVSSLFTNDGTGTRDPKIIEFFFGAMKNTTLISGVFKVIDATKCSIDVTLNGQTANIPLEYEVASINDACKALHTGPDGVSKTWSEVAVQATVLLEKE